MNERVSQRRQILDHLIVTLREPFDFLSYFKRLVWATEERPRAAYPNPVERFVIGQKRNDSKEFINLIRQAPMDRSQPAGDFAPDSNLPDLIKLNSRHL